MKKIILFFILLFVFLNFSAKPIYAIEETENTNSSYDVTYSILDNGLAKVSFLIKLTNKTSKSYAYSYKLNLGFEHIQNVKAFDPDGPIIPEVNKNSDGYTISLIFNKHVVGIGSILNFGLSFETSDLVQKQGQIWEVNIPGIDPKNNFSDFNVSVTAPSFLGKASYVKPEQPTQGLSFSKEQLGNSGISIAFGDSQIYDFNLKYHLRNSNLFSVKTEIAIPPQTNYQNVTIENIDPPPFNVEIDSDGNWLAQYLLKSGDRKDVAVKGKVKIFLNPKKEILTDKQKLEYLKEKPYWQVNDSKIKELSNRFKTPEEIYNYVSSYLTYDFSRVTSNKSRVGASDLLKNPSSAVCLEFTDLFIAIARAAGIPAREVDGFAYAENSKQRPLSLVKDVLHAWPEYYNKEKETWVMVDPTWGNTTKGVDYFKTLDFDHFAFVVKGVDSNYPIPAGGYKLPENLDTKDVSVEFAKQFDDYSPTFEVATSLTDSIIAGMPINGAIIVKNTGKIFSPPESLIIESDFLKPGRQLKVIPALPPYGFTKLPITFSSVPFNTFNKTSVKISLHGNVLEKEIKINPVYMTKWGLIGGVFLGIFTVAIFTIAAKTRSLFISRQKK